MNRRPLKAIARALLVLAAAANLNAATDLATVPLVTSSNSSVLPNILFILDDSGSMDWDYLPDWANDSVNGNPVASTYPYLFQNSSYNGVAYNPAVTYAPPTFFTAAGASDTTTYPSMTGTSAATGGDASASSGAPNWRSVRNDGYGIQSSAYSNVEASARYWTIVPGEYCSNASLRSCNAQSAASTDYPHPAYLRWCNSTALATCQATWISGSYIRPRIPSPTTTAITVGGSGSTAVTSVTVGGTEILSAATAASSTTSTVAARIAAAINNGSTGYGAIASGSTVTVYAPTNVGATPVITKTPASGSMSFTTAAFAKGAIYGSTTVPGTNILTVVSPGRDSYAYPGTAAKASARSDCAGATCTYREEMTNYANWWAYYRTRMQMMKSSASAAFAPIGSSYRVGYITIDKPGSSNLDFLNVQTFDAAAKHAWYQKFFSANPSPFTPLRGALSRAGRLFAGKLNGTTLDGSTVTDPMQYSCQQNFTILSTDGYWNTNDETAAYGPLQLDGATAVGNQDGAEPRPYNDGASSVETAVTPYTTVVRKRTETPMQTVTPWTRTVTSVSAAANCTAEPALGCRQDNASNSSGSTRTWCITDNNDGDDCNRLDGSGSVRIYACRGQGNATAAPPGGTGCKTDDNGDIWCIYSGNSTAGTAACERVRTGNSLYGCKVTATNGYTVTRQTQTYNQVATGSTATSVDDHTTSYNQTIVTTNGIAAPATTSTPVTVIANVSSGATATTGDTGAPTGATAWTNGAVTSSCSTAPPAPGTSAAAAGAPATSSAAAAVVTTLSTVGPTAGTTTTTSSSSGGVANTLADVADYYYVTDLRTAALGNCTGAVVPPATVGNDVCSNDVPSSGQDAAAWQHVTTFTLGLGASGYMQFSPSYASATSGDYYDVKNGNTANAAGGVCSWQGDGTTCNWPIPADNSQKNIDDLWHAAVNGRGTYFSATSPATLAAGLSNALAGVSARLGASAAATTSNPNVTSGDNFVFSSTFTTQDWDGQLFRQQIDLTTGAVPTFNLSNPATYDWAAQGQLDANATRTLYTYAPAVAGKLKSFAWASLSAAEQAYFSAPNISTLSQFCAVGVSCLATADQAAAAGASLVAFLRGDRSNEGVATDTSKYYRQRSHVLGDIVNAEAVYVKASLYDYADAGYGDFKAANASRQGMVYVAANDGMLHAFNAGTGAEAWAYVPSLVLPNLYKLADKNYAALHQYFVDGTPVAADICPSAPATACTGAQWRTILVGGLNRGGRGYYALDITDPAAPKALWEFTDANMGYTYGNPEIAKLADGTWAVLFTSGYNNISPGDGVGRLYVVNAATGALIRTISTGSGSSGTPSGLARVRAWADNAMADNTAVRIYGGDLLGNLWRFDINDNVGASGYEAERLTTFYGNAAGTAVQPITTKPELGEVNGNAMVFVGTGRYLGTTDLSDASLQSFYAVKDRLGNAALTPLANPRANGSGFIQQMLTTTACPPGSPATICSAGETVRTGTANAVDLVTDNGWYLDLPDSGERANTDPTLALGTLGFTTNVPNVSACTAGGYSFSYFLDYRSGAPVSTSTTHVVGAKLGNALATRGVFVRLPNNTVVQLTRMSDGTTKTTNVPIGSGSGATRRVSWRELVNE